MILASVDGWPSKIIYINWHLMKFGGYMSDVAGRMLGDNELPGFRAEYYVDPETGETDVHYMWHDLMAHKVRLGGKLAQQIAGLALIEKDLKNAKRWMQKVFDLTAEEMEKRADEQFMFMRDRELFNDVKAFFVASLVFYGKAFTEAQGRNAQMSKDWLDVEYRELHEFFIDYRHNFAAHSGDKKFEYAKTYLVLLPERKSFSPQLTTARIQPDFAAPGNVEAQFIKLVDNAISAVQKRYADMSKRLVDACLTKPASFWLAASQKKGAVDMDLTVNAANKRNRK